MSAANDNILRFPNAAREVDSGRRLIPARLQEARLAKRLNQTELANLVGVKRQSISAYENGAKFPEPETMSAIAHNLGQPISFFTREELPTFGESSALFYRKVGQDTNRRNMACSIYSKWLGELAYTFEPLVNYPEVDLPSFEPDAPDGRYSEEEIEEMAERVRAHFGLGLGPISNVVRLLEAKGVIVCRVEVPGENIEAFSFWHGDRPFIFLASDKGSAVRSRFDIAHELGHLCAHRWITQEDIEDPASLKAIEKEADRFSAAFLLPRKSFPNEVYSPRLLAFVDLKRRWKVAIQAMIYRCKDLGIFDDRQVTNLYKEISRKKWRTREPLDGPEGIPLEQPLLLRKVADLALQSGKLSVDELKTSFRLSPDWIGALSGLPESTFAQTSEPRVSPTLK
ncbi:XRE family transcriptional regulator [Citromicrobium bathyomarinum]|uniref:XRE family transcriptional regulator n=1 Tax=Citromicrobium bathyomarinum TaxID=72174 RepID=UPI001E442CDA|nr:XRE family transcriptional regulator [Citromicrobium bathyomarinum]MCD1621571.1 XRE family transcriptional regulator [Citromicrobium bathyomarinum]